MAEGGYDPRIVEDRRQRSRNQICRYFLQGRCSQGEVCRFSHDKSQIPPPSQDKDDSMVCRFFLEGRCMFGAKCRFSHVQAEKSEGAPRQHDLSSRESNPRTSNMVTLKKGGCPPTDPDQYRQQREYERKWAMASTFVPGQRYHGTFPSSYADAVQPARDLSLGAEGGQPLEPPKTSEDALICPFFEHDAVCPYEERCTYVHPLICEMCLLPRLHPYNKEQQDQHIKECIDEHKREMDLAFALQASKDKECGICLENVLEKDGEDVKRSDKRFGILENCNHCFCLPCIRTWRYHRSTNLSVQRTCPTCRTHSDFVTPSEYWVESLEEKQQLIATYKDAMKLKPCQYFKQGKGECPFNSKCFYKHALEDGTVVQGNTRKRRRRVNADGENTAEEDYSLWDFISHRDEEGGLVTLSDELSLVLYGIFEDMNDEDDNNNSFALRYNFEEGDFVFTDSDTDSD